DDPDRLRQRAARADVHVVAGAGGLTRELHRDAHEREPTHELHVRDLEQHGGDRDQRHAQDDRAHRAEHTAEHLLASRERAHGERDDQRVVAGQQEIDDDDAAEPREELRIERGRRHRRHPSPSRRLYHSRTKRWSSIHSTVKITTTSTFFGMTESPPRKWTATIKSPPTAVTDARWDGAGD